MHLETKMPVLSTKPRKIPAGREEQVQDHAGRFPILIPIVVVVVLLAPFLRRAFSIDDPLFVWMAEQILKHPLDPYGFNVNWGYVQEPMSKVLQNPPLNSYFIAGVIRLVGLRETMLHAAFILPAVATTWGIYLIARRFCAHPIEATLAAVLTPAFLVCGSTVMCDVMMLAFWVWAVHLWLKGMDDNRLWMILAASVLIALSALTKYYGVVLIPLLLAYSLLARRRPAWWLLSLLIPVLVLIAYNYWTKSLYDRGLILDAFGLSGQYRSALKAAMIPKTVIGLAFTGGCLASVIFLAPLLWSRRALAGWVGLAAILVVLFGATGHIGESSLRLEGGLLWILAGHLGMFTAAGAGLLLLAFMDLAARKDADSALLFLWVAGTIVFVVAFNWSVNGRVLLPMAPAIGIIMMRRIERRGIRISASSFALPWVLSALLAITVAHADYQWANSQRTAAYAIIQEFPTRGTVWFQGHWGFQYYMQRLGAKPLEYMGTRFEADDLVVVPLNNAIVNPPPEDLVSRIETFPGSTWLSTMGSFRQTGFHSDARGPIPYGFGLTAPEIYYIMILDQENFDLLAPPG